MPLSNLNSVMAEANSGKMTRRLHFQEELGSGSSDISGELGLTHACLPIFLIYICFLKIF